MTPAQLYLNLACNNIDTLHVMEYYLNYEN
jgi:hypothetical protein